MTAQIMVTLTILDAESLDEIKELRPRFFLAPEGAQQIAAALEGIPEIKARLLAEYINAAVTQASAL